MNAARSLVTFDVPGLGRVTLQAGEIVPAAWLSAARQANVPMKRLRRAAPSPTPPPTGHES